MCILTVVNYCYWKDQDRLAVDLKEERAARDLWYDLEVSGTGQRGSRPVLVDEDEDKPGDVEGRRRNLNRREKEDGSPLRRWGSRERC